jgi:ABC-type dipeptide/oligopeptide/nickel transport system permease subunit
MTTTMTTTMITPATPSAMVSTWSRLRLQSRLGVAVLAIMVAACFLTLPWTLGREASDSGRSVPRYNAGRTTEALSRPTWSPTDPQRAWGTDALGRSVLVRCLAGGATSLVIGMLAAAVSVSIGTLWGAVAAYSGGRIDSLMMRIVDVLYGLPYVLLVVLLAVASDSLVDEHVSRRRERSAWERERLAATLGEHAPTPAAMAVMLRAPDREATAEVRRVRAESLEAVPPRTLSEGTRTLLNLGTLLVAIGGVSWLTMARVVRGQVLTLKERAFVEAAKAAGASPARIFRVHLLPNLTGTIVVYATLTVPQAILQESFLSFLGVGVQPPMPSWGTLAAEGLGEINPYGPRWWLLALPCVLLSLTLLSLNFIGEGIREAVDPRAVRRGTSTGEAPR